MYGSGVARERNTDGQHANLHLSAPPANRHQCHGDLYPSLRTSVLFLSSLTPQGLCATVALLYRGIVHCSLLCSSFQRFFFFLLKNDPFTVIKTCPPFAPASSLFFPLPGLFFQMPPPLRRVHWAGRAGPSHHRADLGRGVHVLHHIHPLDGC